LRLVHNLQLLNTVTIHDTSVPPFVEHFVESFAGYAVYGMINLYSGYGQCMLHKELCDLMTFGMPLDPHRLTTLPQGHTNTAQVFQGDITFILQDKIPNHTLPFIDDITVKSVEMRYELVDGTFEMITENHGICCFI
jgi:hypothetical protein